MKEHTCKFKIDKTTYSKRSPEQHMTLVKIDLYCILNKAIMLRTTFRKQFLKNKTLESGIKYKKQRNVCISLTEKANRNYFENLNRTDITDNKQFWNTVKPLLQKILI